MILTTALDLLAERSLVGVTMDEIAARTGKAKTTLYRRWATKDDLVLATVRSIGRPPEFDELPDRGSLRADLLAVIDSPWLGGPDRRLAIFAGLGAAARSSAPIDDLVRSEVTEPYVEIYRRLLFRAVDRGEVTARHRSRIPTLAQVIPAMSSHQLAASGETVQREFFVAVVDDVVLAALVTES